jgi:signal peptide peptidase SppA
MPVLSFIFHLKYVCTVDIKVLLQAFNHPWLIHPDAAQHYSLVAHKLFTSEKASWFDDDDEEETKEFAWIVNASGERIGSIEDAVNNGIAVINMQGAVMKYDFCGAPGTQSMMKALQQANNNPSVSAIVLQIDSPGGSVDGTQQFANAVKNSAKPVVAYINGMMASAAMWIGSAASQRIASSNTDVIGSIGTMASWNDFSGYMEKLGIKRHEVYATDSTHKNFDFREANKGNYEPLVKTWLDPLNSEFTGAIQENLPNVDKTVLNGSHFIAKDAKKKGLVDKIGNFETAVKTAMKLSKEQNLSIDNNMNIKSTFKNILSFLGVKNEANAETVELNEEQLQKIEAALPELEAAKGKITELETAATESATKVTALESEKTQLTQKVTELQAEVTRLGALDAGKVSTTTAVADKHVDANDSSDALNMQFQKDLYSKVD